MENMKSQTGGTRSRYPRFDIFFVIQNTFSMLICKICHHMHLGCAWPVGALPLLWTCRPAGQPWIPWHWFCSHSAVILILFSLCDEAQAVLRSAGLRLCWSYAKEVGNILPHPLHFIPIPRLSWRHFGPKHSNLPLQDVARISRSCAMHISINTKGSSHRICQYRVQYGSNRFISVKMNRNHAKSNS